MKHDNYCTHVKYHDDFDILNRQNFDVNIRLLMCNEHYFDIVRRCVDLIIICARNEKEGYKKPHGWSGANSGIPFRIIALADGRYFINPKISNQRDKKTVKSNCGSLTLEKPKVISRYKTIDLNYFTLDGKNRTWNDIGPDPGFTIQHEVDHCDGILISRL